MSDDPRDDDDPESLDADPEQTVELPIGEEIDLHAFQPRDILSVVEAYLDACALRRFREVRLIHGRGRGVQRAAIQRMLRERADVADFGDASPASGGWGATIVRFVTPHRAQRPEEN